MCDGFLQLWGWEFSLGHPGRSAQLSSGSPSVPATGSEAALLSMLSAKALDQPPSRLGATGHCLCLVPQAGTSHQFLTPLCPLAQPGCFLDLQQASYSIQKIPLCLTAVVMMCLGRSKTSFDVWMSSNPSLPGPNADEHHHLFCQEHFEWHGPLYFHFH